MTRQIRLEAGGDPTLGPPGDVAGARPASDDRLAGAPVPEGNRPGHHPDEEQDRPPLDEFAARLGLRRDPTADRDAAPDDDARDDLDDVDDDDDDVAEDVTWTPSPTPLARTSPGASPASPAASVTGAVRRAAAGALRCGGRAARTTADVLAELSDRVAPRR